MKPIKKINNLQIGKEFYRYVPCAGVFTYVVTQINVSTTSQGEIVQYELECQACTHGYKCLLLCAFDDDNKLQYLRTINNDDDDKQDYWHKECGEFFETKKEVKANAYKKQLDKYKKDIATQKTKLKELEDSYKDIEVLLNTLMADDKDNK